MIRPKQLLAAFGLLATFGPVVLLWLIRPTNPPETGISELVVSVDTTEPVNRPAPVSSFAKAASGRPQKTPGTEQQRTPNAHVFDAKTAQAALEARLYLDEVREFAYSMLETNTAGPMWNYGNNIFDANTLLGRVALREGKLDDAKHYLLEAGRTPGSPQLNSFGPDFVLASELLATNEFDTVLEFLDSVGTFWANPEQRTETNGIWVATHNRQALNSWTQQIRDHKIPNDPKWR